MIKRYCDCCQSEMTESNTPKMGGTSSRLAAEIVRNGVRLGVEVIHSTNGASNSGDVCKYCILDALAKLDDRPKISQL